METQHDTARHEDDSTRGRLSPEIGNSNVKIYDVVDSSTCTWFDLAKKKQGDIKKAEQLVKKKVV